MKNYTLYWEQSLTFKSGNTTKTFTTGKVKTIIEAADIDAAQRKLREFVANKTVLTIYKEGENVKETEGILKKIFGKMDKFFKETEKLISEL